MNKSASASFHSLSITPPRLFPPDLAVQMNHAAVARSVFLRLQVCFRLLWMFVLNVCRRASYEESVVLPTTASILARSDLVVRFQSNPDGLGIGGLSKDAEPLSPPKKVAKDIHVGTPPTSHQPGPGSAEVYESESPSDDHQISLVTESRGKESAQVTALGGAPPDLANEAPVRTHPMNFGSKDNLAPPELHAECHSAKLSHERQDQVPSTEERSILGDKNETTKAETLLGDSTEQDWGLVYQPMQFDTNPLSAVTGFFWDPPSQGIAKMVPLPSCVALGMPDHVSRFESSPPRSRPPPSAPEADLPYPDLFDFGMYMSTGSGKSIPTCWVNEVEPDTTSFKANHWSFEGFIGRDPAAGHTSRDFSFGQPPLQSKRSRHFGRIFSPADVVDASSHAVCNSLDSASKYSSSIHSGEWNIMSMSEVSTRLKAACGDLSRAAWTEEEFLQIIS